MHGKTIRRAFLSLFSLLSLGAGGVPSAEPTLTPDPPGGTTWAGPVHLANSATVPPPGARSPLSIGFTERPSRLNPARLSATFSESSGYLELRVLGDGDSLGPTWILIGLGDTPEEGRQRLHSGGELLVGPPYRILSRGAELHQLPLRDPAGLAGATWSLQAVVWTPDGMALSNALDISVAGSEGGSKSNRR